MTVSEDDPDELNNELAATFKELQDNTVTMAIPGIFIASIFFFGLIGYIPDFQWSLLTGSFLFVLGLVLIPIREKSFLISSLLIILGSLGAVLAVIVWGRLPNAVSLLILPVGLTTLLLGTRVGFGVTLLTSLLLFISPILLEIGNSTLRIISLAAIWSTFGMIWLTLRPLLTAVEGAWIHYDESRKFLRQAQDYQFMLNQTLGDLKDYEHSTYTVKPIGQQLAEDC